MKLDKELFKSALVDCCDKDLFDTALNDDDIKEIEKKVCDNAVKHNENPNDSFLDMRDAVFKAMTDLGFEWPWDD